MEEKKRSDRKEKLKEGGKYRKFKERKKGRAL